MHGAALVLTWAAFGIGILGLALGVTSLERRRVVLPWLRQRAPWRQYGWSQVLMSAFVLLETVPRLSNVSLEIIRTLSAIAFVPLIAAVVVMMRTPRGSPRSTRGRFGNYGAPPPEESVRHP